MPVERAVPPGPPVRHSLLHPRQPSHPVSPVQKAWKGPESLFAFLTGYPVPLILLLWNPV